MPDLVGVKEAAAILGWDRRVLSVHNGRRAKGLPAPLTPEEIKALGLAGLGVRTIWRLETILAYHIEQVLGISVAALRQPEGRANTCRTYGLDSEQPIGAQLFAQGLLSMGAAEWLDRELARDYTIKAEEDGEK